MSPIARGLLGMVLLIGFAWLLSSFRRKFPIKIVLGGLALQFGVALLVLKTQAGQAVFDVIGQFVTAILFAADKAAAFVFGPLAGLDPKHPGVTWAAIAGIKIMTTIVVFSALSSIGYHFGILQRVVAGLAYVMTRLLGVSGAESLSCAANVFVGQTEAPLLVRPYLSRMTRSELMAVMTGGFATIAMGVMGLYVSWLSVGSDGQLDAEKSVTIARHFLTASLMSAPAAFVMAKIMLPETREPVTGRNVKLDLAVETRNVFDAATAGASQGMTLAINVIAMLIAFIGLIALVDLGLGRLGTLWSFGDPAATQPAGPPLSLGLVLGWVFAPVAWVIGAPPDELQKFGSLLGTAMATNEMVAYEQLGGWVQRGEISERRKSS